MSEKIILFDLSSSAPGTCWSLNPWKTRFVLNFKGLDYETKWLSYPDLRPTLESLVVPNETGRPYTSPAVKLADGEYVMDSKKIAIAIEEKHPSPSLHLDSPYLGKVEAIVPKTFGPLMPVIYSEVPRRILTEDSQDYWQETRSAAAGMPLDEFEKLKGGETAWAGTEAGLQEATALLKENADGPFFLGKTVSYADFVWAGLLIFAQRIGDDVFQQVLKRSGDAEPHLKLLEAVAPWSKRNDH